jgi:hypothetical protein
MKKNECRKSRASVPLTASTVVVALYAEPLSDTASTVVVALY